MILLFLLMSFERPFVLLEGELGPPGYVVWREGFIYFLDYTDNRLVKFTETGKQVGVYQKQGIGPGETLTIMHFVLDDKLLYVFDDQQNRLLVLDHDLNFLRQFTVQGSSFKGFARFGDGYVFCGPDLKTKNLIHFYDAKMTPRRAAARIWEPETGKKDIGALFRMNYAGIRTHKATVYLARYYQFQIQAFNDQGAIQGQWDVPGLDADAFRHKDGQNVLGRALEIDEIGRLYLAVVNLNRAREPRLEQERLYRLDPASGAWEICFTQPAFTFHKKNGLLTKAWGRPEDERVVLTDLVDLSYQKIP